MKNKLLLILNVLNLCFCIALATLLAIMGEPIPAFLIGFIVFILLGIVLGIIFPSR